MPPPSSLIRPLVRALRAYVPGEQPKIRGLIKLNTNENPYPPSPKVLAAVRAAVDGRLRQYPNPTASVLREKLARLHRCTPAHIFVGNGSDECLALAVRAFVEPRRAGPRARPAAREIVQYFDPGYSLYPVLADAHGAASRAVPLLPDFGLPSVAVLKQRGDWRADAALTFVTTPNAPSGRGYDAAALDRLCRAQRGVVVLDEAYADFAGTNALGLALKHPHVLVARTFSKAYSLCLLRVGYFVGHPALITALDTIRDSYSVNGLGQVAAIATLTDLPYYRRNVRRIRRTRAALSADLATLGFDVLPSETNFLLVKPPRFPARVWLRRLRARRILVRWFSAPALRLWLRVSIGTEAETAALLAAVTLILRRGSDRGRSGSGRRPGRRKRAGGFDRPFRATLR
jgi:histidinol-phosphate aminotransferase